MSGFLQDLRYALRQLHKNPGFTCTSVLILALGIGANVAIFGIVNGIIVRPLPVPKAQEIAVLAAQQEGAPLEIYHLSYAELVDFRKQAEAFSDIFGYEVGLEGMSSDGKADHIVASYVTGNYFSALRVKPAVGRLFLPGEGEKPGSAALVVIGYSYWQKRFAGSDVIGKQVLVDGRPATIIGVTPKNFQGTAFALDMDGYLPLSMAASDDPDLWTSRTDRRWITLGRMMPHVSLAQAQTSLSLVASRLTQLYPAAEKGLTVSAVSEPLSHSLPLPNNLNAVIAGIFLFLATVVLLLASLNVANILLVRAVSRQGEIAIRAAMGASRTRLIRAVLAESILLALFGAVAGIGVGTWASRAISDLRLTSALPLTLDFGLDWRVLGYTLACAILAMATVVLWPALRVVRSNANDILREGGRSGSAGAGRHSVRSVLVGAQIAGSLLLLIIAGLLVRSVQSAQRMYLGFDPVHVLNVILDPHQVGYDEGRSRGFYQQLEERVRTLPGVQSASLAFSVPMGNYNDGAAITIEGHPTPAGTQAPLLLFNAIDPTYLSTMRIPLLRGRNFNETDNENSVHVALINQTMANRFWPNEDPIGKRFSTSETNRTLWQVVGVTPTGKYDMLAEDPQPFFYLPLAQKFTSMRVLQIRSSVAPEALISPVQQVIKDLDPGLPVFSIRTMTDSLNGANGFLLFRIGALLASCIGTMGMIMAVVGVYGVVAFAASQRTREIGIRVALGASRRQVLKLILRQGISTVLVGAALGLLLTFAISREIAYVLIGVSATDPLTLFGATIFLVAVALYASYVPARRAMQLDPVVALRYE